MTNFLLAYFGQDDLAIYFIVNVIVYLIITLSHASLNIRAQKSVNRLGAILFTGFLFVLVFKIVEIAQ